MVSCLTCDHNVGGSIPCQAKATLLIRSRIVLSSLQATVVKNYKSEAEFIMSNTQTHVKLAVSRCYKTIVTLSCALICALIRQGFPPVFSTEKNVIFQHISFHVNASHL